MLTQNKVKIVSALESMEFKIDKVELVDKYWHIGYRKPGIDGLVYFMVEDKGYDLQQLIWQFCGFRNSEGK